MILCRYLVPSPLEYCAQNVVSPALCLTLVIARSNLEDPHPRFNADLLNELTQREKEQGIHPDPDVDYYMKVNILTLGFFTISLGTN